MHTLDGGRIGIAAQALGIAEGALDRVVAYTRKESSLAVLSHSSRIPSSSLLIWLQESKLLSFWYYKAAMAKATQKVYSVEAAKAKLFAAETAMDVTTRCVQLFGGYGYIREYDVERMMRDAKITEIYEGTCEVQRMVISGALLK